MTGEVYRRTLACEELPRFSASSACSSTDVIFSILEDNFPSTMVSRTLVPDSQ